MSLAELDEENLLGLGSDIPDDLPLLPVDNLFDDYISFLTTHTNDILCQDTSSYGAHSSPQLGSSSEPSTGAAVVPAAGERGSDSQNSQNSQESRTLGPYEHSTRTATHLVTVNSPGRESAEPNSGHQHLEAEHLPNGRMEDCTPSLSQHEEQSWTLLPPVIQFDTLRQQAGLQPRTSPASSLEIPLPDNSMPESEGLEKPTLDWLGINGLELPSSSTFEPAGLLMHSQAHEALLPSSGYNQGTCTPADMAVQANMPMQMPVGFSHSTLNHPVGLQTTASAVSPGLANETTANGSPSWRGPILKAGTEDNETALMDGSDDCHSDNEADGQPDATGGPKKPRRRRNRSERQQMLNKFAQQRYRERKKQKALDVQRAAAELATKMENYTAVQMKYKSLDEQNKVLLSRLAAQEAELASLASAPALHAGPSRGSSAPDGESPSAAEAESVKLALHERVFQLQEHMRSNGLLEASQGLAYHQRQPEVLKALHLLVEDVLALSLSDHHLEGVDVWSMMRASQLPVRCPANCRCSMCHQKETWTDVALALNLNPAQCRQLLHVRQQYLEKLNLIFRKRNDLNLEAVSVMLPQGLGGTVPQMLSGQAASYASMGFFQRARHTAVYAGVLERLKQNLRDELRAASELDYILFRRILDTVQGGRLIVEAYPLKSNAMALANAVAFLCQEDAARASAGNFDG